MTKLLSLALLLLSTVFAHAQIECRSTAFYDAATLGNTRIIVGQATNPVYVCGFVAWAGGTGTVKLVTGTGTNCGTNEVSITPGYSLIAGTGVSDSSPQFRGLQAAAGLDVCVKTSAAVAVQVQVFYAQR